MNRELLVGEIWENLYMSRCSSTLVIKEMQIKKKKPRLRFTLIRLLKIKKEHHFKFTMEEWECSWPSPTQVISQKNDVVVMGCGITKK